MSRAGSIDNVSPLVGGLLHIAVSCMYGALFASACQLPVRRWFPTASIWTVTGIGLGYGGLLLILAQFVLLPQTGSPLFEIPPAHFAIAHLMYGASLGFLVGRNGLKAA